ncbi:MAG: hypothetical protein KJ053_06950 [Dehalococcoidia bacterium]|nr:hypothetical protein [Dehalococcoidia bacterium]
MIEGIERLSPREKQVLALVAAGLSNKGIARELDLSEATVKGYVHTLYLKLGIQSRARAARVWTLHQVDER